MPSKLFLVDLDLNGNQLLNTVVENRPSAPTIVEGRIYYDTSLHQFRYWNGTAWIGSRSILNAAEEGTNQVYVIESSTQTEVKFRLLKGDDYIKFASSGGIISVTFKSEYIKFEKGDGENSVKVKNANLLARNANEVALGEWNNSIAGTGGAGTIFTIGIGSSNVNRLNAVEVRKNGDVYLNGADGTVQQSMSKTQKLAARASSVEVSLNGNLWYDAPGAKTITANAIPSAVRFNNYDGEVISHPDSVIVTATTQAGTFRQSCTYSGGYYYIPYQMIFNAGTDYRIQLLWEVEYENITKTYTNYLYGLRAPKYFGRTTKTPTTITAGDITGLTRETSYTWGNLKYKNGVNIPSTTGDDKYYVYAYPADWGALSKISNALGTYYTPALDSQGLSTFTRKSISVNGMEYYVYIYRDFNAGAASNLTFE
jgi:hypothetical protein